MAKKAPQKRKTRAKRKYTGPQINLSDIERVYVVAALIESNEFRKKMRSDPAATLAEHGIKVEACELPDRLELPRKDFLRSRLSEFMNTPVENRLAHGLQWPFLC